MSIRLTPAAADRVRSYLAQRDDAVGLRLGVRKTGCSGFAYVVGYATGQETGDVVFEDQGVKVLVNEENLLLLDGTEVDFVQEGFGSSFKFHNPNVADECGCGESFSV